MRNRFQIGLFLLLAASVGIWIWQILPPSPRVITVNGYTGGSKAGLFDDSEVKQILADKYQIAVAYNKLGGLEQVCGLPPAPPQDFLWPGTELAVQAYAACHKDKPKVEKLLSSPIVFYSWVEVTNALEKQGLVEKIDGVYYIADLSRFTQLLLEGKPYKDLGLTQFSGNFAVIPSDPTKSNSGGMFAALMASTLLGGKVPTQATIGQVLPDLRNYYDSLGNLDESTDTLFKNYLLKRTPMIVAYESQLQDYATKNNKKCADFDQVRIIYPRPTVWASHPLIAETQNGVRLQQALADPKIQSIAWERHGFRTGLAPIQTGTLALNCFQLPASITFQMQLPKTDVMDQIVKYLGSTNAPAAAAAPSPTPSPTP
jgi:hypothetical protein